MGSFESAVCKTCGHSEFHVYYDSARSYSKDGICFICIGCGAPWQTSWKPQGGDERGEEAVGSGRDVQGNLVPT